MISIIPTTNGISIESRIPVTQSFIGKIENPENEQKVNLHLKDMKCQHKLEEDESGTPISVLKQWVCEPMPVERFETLIKVMKANHDSFIENVNLRMKEVIEFSKNETETKNEADEKLQAVTEILKSIEEMDDSAPVVFGTTVAIFLKCGFLKEILDTYIDKHLSHGNK